MNCDFSKELREMMPSLANKRSGPKSSAQTPAPKKEQKKGSDKNKSGSAGKDGGKITFSEQVTQALKSKVEEHNKKYSRKVSLSQLKKVYRRGAGAYSTSHRPNKTRAQWSMARVNAFLTMMRGGKVKKSYREADQDIAKGSCESCDINFYGDFDELDFALARIDLKKYTISNEEEDFDLEDFDVSESEKKTLNKPFRLPKGSSKKFGVYVKNPKTGNVVMVKFGDPNMTIKRDNPERRKSFRARHKCDTAKDKTTPRYWSCRFWSKNPVSSMASIQDQEIQIDDEFCEDNLPEQQDILNLNPDFVKVTNFIEEDI